MLGTTVIVGFVVFAVALRVTVLWLTLFRGASVQMPADAFRRQRAVTHEQAAFVVSFQGCSWGASSIEQCPAVFVDVVVPDAVLVFD